MSFGILFLCLRFTTSRFEKACVWTEIGAGGSPYFELTTSQGFDKRQEFNWRAKAKVWLVKCHCAPFGLADQAFLSALPPVLHRGSEWVLKDLDFIEAKRKLNLSPEIKERFTAAVKVDSEVPFSLVAWLYQTGDRTSC